MPIGTARLQQASGSVLIPTPNAPTVTATNGVTSTLALSWVNTSSIYQVRVYQTGVLVATLAATTTTYTDTALSANTSYNYTLTYYTGTLEGSASSATANSTAPNPPTAPSASALSATSIQVAWTNAHSVVTYVYRSNGAYVGSAAAGATTYTESGLASGTNYAYYMAHYGFSGTLSAVTATVNATTPLSVPTGLTASATSPTQVALSWTNTLAQQTRVYRGGALVVTLTSGTATYNDTGLTSATAYSYTVRHYNGTVESADSNTANATTPVAPPTGLSASTVSTTQINLAWSNADTTAQTEIYRDSTLVTTVAATGTSYNDTGRTANTQYTYYVRHLKNAIPSAATGNSSAYTNPNAPTALSATAASTSQINLEWTNAHSLTTYIYRGGVYITSEVSGVTSYSDTGLTASTGYNYTVRHYNAASGLTSSDSNTGSATTQSAAPSAPTGLSATSASPSQINLAWTNTDAAAQTRVYRGGALVTTVASAVTTFSDTGLTSATAYTYTVRHFKATVESVDSAGAGATTSVSTPTSLAGTPASDSVINITWANTDAGAQTRIYRGGVLLNTVAATVTTYSDTGRAGNTQYAYTVSHIKNTVESAQTGSVAVYTFPSAPISLTATATSSSQINLSWTNSHSTATYVYRNGTYVTALAAGVTTYSNTGLTDSTSYNYTVRHYNATSTLLSGASNTATATTQAPPSITITSATVNNTTDTISVAWTSTGSSADTRFKMVFVTSTGGVATTTHTRENITSPYTLSSADLGSKDYDAGGANLTDVYIDMYLVRISTSENLAAASQVYTFNTN